MKIAKDAIVSIDYTLTDDEGDIIDSSEGEAPLAYLHGHGQLVPGLERALEGKVKGDELSVDVAPADGYGEVEPGRVLEVPRGDFPKDLELAVGMQITAENDRGEQMPVFVSDIAEETVILDGNHPLAGQTLHFQVRITDVRKATQEELRHGHAHGPGGAH